jgi:hypothetical protein
VPELEEEEPLGLEDEPAAAPAALPDDPAEAPAGEPGGFSPVTGTTVQ